MQIHSKSLCTKRVFLQAYTSHLSPSLNEVNLLQQRVGGGIGIWTVAALGFRSWSALEPEGALTDHSD